MQYKGVALLAEKLEIPVRGEDGYKVSSVRLKQGMWAALDEIAKKSNRSRNEVIGMMLEYCIGNAVITGEKE